MRERKKGAYCRRSAIRNRKFIVSDPENVMANRVSERSDDIFQNSFGVRFMLTPMFW